MIGELFDPHADFSIRETCKPHWSQTGAVVLITFRTWDSIPVSVLQRWDRERCDWLIRAKVMPPDVTHWQDYVAKLSAQEANRFRKHFRQQKVNIYTTARTVNSIDEP